MLTPSSVVDRHGSVGWHLPQKEERDCGQGIGTECCDIHDYSSLVLFKYDESHDRVEDSRRGDICFWSEKGENGQKVASCILQVTAPLMLHSGPIGPLVLAGVIQQAGAQ